MKYIFLLLTVFSIYSQNENFEKKTFIYELDTLNYRILKPLDYDSKKKYPVHLFLHGAGERGNDNESQLIHGSDLFLKKENRENYKSWVIFPQAPLNEWWGGHYDAYKFNYQVKISSALNLVIKFMDQFIERNDVDKNKIYVSGLSMGGMGTFSILSQRPDMFAAATPICGDGDPNSVESFAKKVPIWIFHGALDRVVHPNKSLIMAQALIEKGGNPRVTIYENVYHDSWNNAFDEKDFLSWIHSKSKTNE